MTSAISRDDIQDLAWRSGVKDPKKLGELMRMIDAYTWNLARSITREPDEGPVEPEEKKGKGRGSHDPQYLCHRCGGRFTLGFFPEVKKLDPSVSADCAKCGGKIYPKLYRCTGLGMCHQAKPLVEFPLRKQEDPLLRTPCRYCDDRRLTVRDAR